MVVRGRGNARSPPPFALPPPTHARDADALWRLVLARCLLAGARRLRLLALALLLLLLQLLLRLLCLLLYCGVGRDLHRDDDTAGLCSGAARAAAA